MTGAEPRPVDFDAVVEHRRSAPRHLGSQSEKRTVRSENIGKIAVREMEHRGTQELLSRGIYKFDAAVPIENQYGYRQAVENGRKGSHRSPFRHVGGCRLRHQAASESRLAA